MITVPSPEPGLRTRSAALIAEAQRLRERSRYIRQRFRFSSRVVRRLHERSNDLLTISFLHRYRTQRQLSVVWQGRGVAQQDLSKYS